MATLSQPIPVGTTGSPRGRRSVRMNPSTSGSPAGLHASDRDAFNVNQMVPDIELGVTATQQTPVPGSSNGPSGKKSFSKLGQLARRAMGKQSQERRAEEGRAEEGRGSPSAPAVSPAESSSHIDSTEGTTIVDHNDELPIGETTGSPVFVEPKRTDDYAKMESPNASIVSFASYIDRIKRFFSALNDLPWVAERVTVDYVPGAGKDRRQFQRMQRPISWYGTHSRPSIFSDSPSPISRQAQLPNSFATLFSLQHQQPPQQEVVWEILDPAKPSNAPFATVVPANWSLHQGLPPDPLQPTMPTQQPQPEPPEIQPAENPPRPPPQQPAPAAEPYPSTVGDEFQRFASNREAYPTGYVQHAEAANIEATYHDRRFHPRSQDPAPQSPVLPQGGPTSTTQADQGGFGIGAPQTPRGLNFTPLTTSFGQPATTSLPPSDAPTPYYTNTNTHPAMVFPSPHVGSGSAAAAPGVGPDATPQAFASPGRPPSHLSSGPAPSVRVVQGQGRPRSVAPSHVSRASSAMPGAYQTPNRPQAPLVLVT